MCIDELSIVHDIKCPWSLRTFRQSEMTKVYDWQIRGYMWLKNYDFAELNYTLVDAPEELIEDEIRRRAFYEGYIDDSLPAFDPIKAQIRHNMTFGYIPAEKRLKSFLVQRDTLMEEQLMERIHLWRQTLKNMDI